MPAYSSSALLKMEIFKVDLYIGFFFTHRLEGFGSYHEWFGGHASSHPSQKRLATQRPITCFPSILQERQLQLAHLVLNLTDRTLQAMACIKS